MRRISILVAACATVATLGLGASGALAADKPSLADDVAARLGISVDQLRAAFKDALGARIDAAVAAGKLTPEQGAKLKERIASAQGLGIGLRKHFAKHHKAFRGRIVARSRGLGRAAEYLGLTRPELRSELRDGSRSRTSPRRRERASTGSSPRSSPPCRSASTRQWPASGSRKRELTRSSLD